MKNKHSFNLHRKWKLISTITCLFVATISIVALISSEITAPKEVDAVAESNINPPDLTKQTMNVLVVEINPRLKTIPDQPKVTEYVYPVSTSGDHARITVEETVSDLEFSSGGYLDINTTWEYLDEFPRYKKTITLPDGTSAKQLDEANFLRATGGQSGSDGYWNVLRGEWAQQISTGDFDYDYLIDRLDLVNRRENGEFDQVWVIYIEPSGAFETMMVGRGSYWINGTPTEAECDNFIIAGFNVERRDSQLHALGHAYENIMNEAYGSRFNTYSNNAKDSINISTKEQYLGLNLWERFTVNDYVNAGTINGIGTVHHPYNAREDYDYSNTTNVNTTYHEWNGEISDMVGDYLSNNSSAWNATPFNDGGPDLSGGRYYMRFWLRHFPRQTGYTSDGYLKNWWKYLFSLNHVESAVVLNPAISLSKNQEVTLSHQITYNSGQKENKSSSKKYDNISISNPDVVEEKNGKLMTKYSGQSTITMYVEGSLLEWTVTVKANQAVSFVESSISKTYGDSSFTKTATTTGDGAITYTSSDHNVATVDSNTGRVSIIGAGTTVITATAASTDGYEEGTASYTLIVTAKQPEAGTNENEGTNTGNSNANSETDDDSSNYQNSKEETVTIPETLPEASTTSNDSENNSKEKIAVVASNKASVTTPDTGSSTKSKEGNTLSSCIAPTVIISVVFSFVLCRHKSHRKYD